MNNKKLGTAWEKRYCEILKKDGWWVHFISPDNRGAQPFDVIACKNGEPMAVDCKTTINPIFSMNRIEVNQKLAFAKWYSTGNKVVYIAIKWKDQFYEIPYTYLLKHGKVDLREWEGLDVQ